MTASTPFQLDGGCDCRKIRYRITAKPMFAHCCHCTWCQRETGSAFCLNAIIETEFVTLLGECSPEIIDTPTIRKTSQKMARCPDCNIAVWSNYGNSFDLLRWVRVGTLDQPDEIGGPSIHIYTSTKQKWVDLDRSAVPVMWEYYDRKEYWPKESLERIAPVSAEIRRRQQLEGELPGEAPSLSFASA